MCFGRYYWKGRVLGTSSIYSGLASQMCGRGCEEAVWPHPSPADPLFSAVSYGWPTTMDSSYQCGGRAAGVQAGCRLDMTRAFIFHMFLNKFFNNLALEFSSFWLFRWFKWKHKNGADRKPERKGEVIPSHFYLNLGRGASAAD